MELEREIKILICISNAKCWETVHLNSTFSTNCISLHLFEVKIFKIFLLFGPFGLVFAAVDRYDSASLFIFVMYAVASGKFYAKTFRNKMCVVIGDALCHRNRIYAFKYIVTECVNTICIYIYVCVCVEVLVNIWIDFPNCIVICRFISISPCFHGTKSSSTSSLYLSSFALAHFLVMCRHYL